MGGLRQVHGVPGLRERLPLRHARPVQARAAAASLRAQNGTKMCSCVDACLTDARIFGDLDDPESEVSKLINSVETFRLLEDLGTGPQIYFIPDLGGKA